VRIAHFHARSLAVAGLAATIAIASQLPATAVTRTAVTRTGVANPASVAGTGGPGHWTQVTAAAVGSGTSKDIGLVRDANGVLHVIWEDGSVAGSEKIIDTPIEPDGTVGKPVTIAGNLYDATDPDATATATGLDAFWNGYQGLPGSNLPTGTFWATHPLKGGSWKLAGNVPPVNAGYYSSSDAATTGGDGVPWVAWTTVYTVDVLHLGHPEKQISSSACCVYNAGLATDGVSGTSYVSYMSDRAGHSGLFVQRLADTGGAASGAALLPGSLVGGSVPAYNERIPITGRGKGKAGVYAAYLTGNPYPRVVGLFKIGSKAPVKVASISTGFIDGDAVTAAPDGRLWVTWWYGGSMLYTRVSGTTGTTFGKTVRVPVPAGTVTIWKVYTSAQNGRLDVLALMTTKTHEIAYFATQVLLPKA
jgi:hypothetical protein